MDKTGPINNVGPLIGRHLFKCQLVVRQYRRANDNNDDIDNDNDNIKISSATGKLKYFLLPISVARSSVIWPFDSLSYVAINLIERLD